MTSIPNRCAELRADFIDRGLTKTHIEYLDGIVRSARMNGDKLFPYEWDGHDLGHDLVKTMRLAEMWSVTPEMQDLIEHAAKSLPPQVLKRESLPSQTGFLYLPKPLWMEDIRGDHLPIRVITWHERELGREGESPGKDLPHVARGVTLNMHVLNGEDGDLAFKAMTPEERRRIASQVPTVSLFHAMSVAFDRQVWDIDTSDMVGVDPEVRAEIGRRTSRSLHDGETIEHLPDGRWLIRTSEGYVVKARADNVIQFLHAYFHFVESTLSSMDREHPSKTLVKWMRRLGMPDGPISVVRLRRHEVTGKGMGGWVLSYRHVRRGHWRAQWYGSGEHRYQQHIFIAPTIVGPDDGPLRVRDVVNILDH